MVMQKAMHRYESIPRAFCWTRFGTEAGESFASILARKEAERRANDGIFLWGIGNSIGPAVSELVARVDTPEVLFSPIKSRPRQVDVAPAHVVRWTRAEDLHGRAFDLPSASRVLSRWTPGRRGAHYALVCASADALELDDRGCLSFGALRNLRSGARLGASQVTAVVEREEANAGGSEYLVALRAALVAPYFVRLRQPEPLGDRRDDRWVTLQLQL